MLYSKRKYFFWYEHTSNMSNVLWDHTIHQYVSQLDDFLNYKSQFYTNGMENKEKPKFP